MISITERPAALADVPMLAALLNEHMRPYVHRDVMPVEVLDSVLRMPANDPERDGRVLLVGDEPVAGSFVSAHEPFAFARMYLTVPPRPNRRAIAAAAVASGVATARRRAELSPSTEILVEGVPGADEELQAVLGDHGFALRYSGCEMHRDLTGVAAPAWPNGVTVTPMPTDVERLSKVAEANREAFTDHDGDHAMPVDDFVHMVLTAPTWRPDLSLVAWRADEPVGLALNGLETDGDGASIGYVGSLGVRREARGAGLGRALLLGSFELMAAAGLSRVMLHVQLGNRTGADRLYQSVGMTPGPREQTWAATLGDLAQLRFTPPTATTR
jgi:mycothiol synthase